MKPVPFSKTAVLEQIDAHLSGLNSLIDDFMFAHDSFYSKDTIPAKIKSRNVKDIMEAVGECKAAMNNLIVLKQEIEEMPMENNQHITTEAMRNSLNDELIQLSSCLHNDVNKLYAQAASTNLMRIKFNRENMEDF